MNEDMAKFHISGSFVPGWYRPGDAAQAFWIGVKPDAAARRTFATLFDAYMEENATSGTLDIHVRDA